MAAITQTRDGYLWLGTYGGLVRFDGSQFTVFNSANEPGLQSDRVTAAYEDAQSNLWIGHERGDLTRYHDGIFDPQNLHETSARRKVSGISTDEAGDIWMLNEEGTLLRARDGAACSLPNNDGVVEMVRDRQRMLWVASGGKLAVLKKGHLELLAATNHVSAVFGGYIQGICASRDGGVWIVTSKIARN